jgi:hypothetical protein
MPLIFFCPYIPNISGFCYKRENSNFNQESIDSVMVESTKSDSGAENTVKKISDYLGHLLSSSLFNQVPVVSDEIRNDSMLNSRLISACQMLCISHCGETELKYGHNYYTTGTCAALNLILTNFSTITLPASSSDIFLSCDESSHVITNRNKAFEDLKLALNFLNAELQLARFRKDVRDVNK